MCIGIIGTLQETWLDGGVPMGRVRTADADEIACLLYAPDTAIGSSVLVHLGFVTEVLDPRRAADATELRQGPGREAVR